MQHGLSVPKAVLSRSLAETSDPWYDLDSLPLCKRYSDERRNLNPNATSSSHRSVFKTIWTISLKSWYPHIHFLASFSSLVVYLHFLMLVFSLKSLGWPFSSTALSLCSKRQLKSMSQTAQLLVCLPSPTVADKTVLSLFFSRGQVASNNGDQTQKLHLQSLLFFFFLFYLRLSCFLCERKARFQKGDSLTAATSAHLSWCFLPMQSLPFCIQVSELTMYQP